MSGQRPRLRIVQVHRLKSTLLTESRGERVRNGRRRDRHGPVVCASASAMNKTGWKGIMFTLIGSVAHVTSDRSRFGRSTIEEIATVGAKEECTD